MNESWLLWGLLFGSIGLGYALYGRKQRRAVPLLAGLTLMAFPYFVSDTTYLVLTGLVLILIPVFIRT